MLEKLQEIFRKVFNNKNLLITSNTSGKDIKMWDSLIHLELIASIENKFQINFSFDEVMLFNTVGDIIIVLEKKVNNK